MEKIQAEKDAAIKSLNGKCEKIEKSIEHLKEDLENKTSIINGLEIKLEELEKRNIWLPVTMPERNFHFHSVVTDRLQE